MNSRSLMMYLMLDPFPLIGLILRSDTMRNLFKRFNQAKVTEFYSTERRSTPSF
jgi:hypothetical protein